jgi:hypothetical protein|tara:strand:+ start:156 stop:371 length:216 start_codon:yes stop_codon:yes gene_type:complete
MINSEHRLIFWTLFCLAMHAILSTITVLEFGLSAISILAGPAFFILFMATTQQATTLALIGLGILYQIEVY